MEKNSRQRLSVRVTGRVQGVNFRSFTLHRARDLGLGGWVKNEPDGTVRIEAEGPSDDLDRLVKAVRTGPPAARVDDLEVERGEASNAFNRFDVRYR